MASTTKANTYRVYLNDDNAGTMGAICKATELSQSELLTKLVVAGLQCVKADGYRITLPLRFEMTGNPLESESPPTRKRLQKH
jgi:hypothetical protein